MSVHIATAIGAGAPTPVRNSRPLDTAAEQRVARGNVPARTARKALLLCAARGIGNFGLGLALAALVSGCATSHKTVYEKAGVTQAQHDRDENECLRSAMNVEGSRGMTGSIEIDRETYARCMESRGYTARSD